MAKRSPDAPMIDLPMTLITVPDDQQTNFNAKRANALAWIKNRFSASQKRIQGISKYRRLGLM